MVQARYLPTDPMGRMGHLVEECSEVQKCIGKIMRFGPESLHWHNGQPQKGVTNRMALKRELGDLRYAIAAILEDLNEPD